MMTSIEDNSVNSRHCIINVSNESMSSDDTHGPIGLKSSMIQKCIKVEMWSLRIQVYDGPKVISNDRMEFEITLGPECGVHWSAWDERFLASAPGGL